MTLPRTFAGADGRGRGARDLNPKSRSASDPFSRPECRMGWSCPTFHEVKKAPASLPGLQVRSIMCPRDCSLDALISIPKHKSHKWLSKKCRSLSKRCKSNNRSALYYSSNRRLMCVERKAAMKRCALCHGRLGLGARFRNIWNGHWWVHVRFCSVRCEGIYEVRRNEAAKHRWHTFLAGRNSPNRLIGPTA